MFTVWTVLHWGNIRLCNILINRRNTLFYKQVKSQRSSEERVESIWSFLYSPHSFPGLNRKNNQFYYLLHADKLALKNEMQRSHSRWHQQQRHAKKTKRPNNPILCSSKRKWSDTLAGTSVFAEDNLKKSVDSRLWKTQTSKHPCCFFPQCYVIRGMWKSAVSNRRGLLTGEGSLSALCRSLNSPVPIFIGIPIMMHSDTPERGTQEMLRHN